MPFLFLDIDDDLLLDNFFYIGVPEPLVDNTLAFFHFSASSHALIMLESESRFLQNDGLLKLVVVVVNSMLALTWHLERLEGSERSRSELHAGFDLAPRKAGRFRAQEVRKINEPTWIPSIVRLTPELTSKTQALVGTGGRLSFPHSFEG